MGEHGRMAMPNVEAEVIDLVANERGLPYEKVQLSSRLLGPRHGRQ
jgi:hypothetical protein